MPQRRRTHINAHTYAHTHAHLQTIILYLCTVLGLGHGCQELEYRLRLGHQRGDGVDDRRELGVRFNA